MLDQMDKNNELRVKFQSDSFTHEVKDLRAVAKEHHWLFVQDVKWIQEDVNLKIKELQ